MGIRKHLTYANVAATLALAGVIGGGGAYAASQIGSNDLKNNSVRSVDLKNRKAVKARDVRRNALTGSEIKERTLLASGFAPMAGEHDSCDPGNAIIVDCARTTVRLPRPGRLFIIATGDFFGEASGASLECRISIDDDVEIGASFPGEIDGTTSFSATNGFARTFVSERLSSGKHQTALSCSQLGAADGQLASASIAVLGITGR